MSNLQISAAAYIYILYALKKKGNKEDGGRRNFLKAEMNIVETCYWLI